MHSHHSPTSPVYLSTQPRPSFASEAVPPPPPTPREIQPSESTDTLLQDPNWEVATGSYNPSDHEPLKTGHVDVLRGKLLEEGQELHQRGGSRFVSTAKGTKRSGGCLRGYSCCRCCACCIPKTRVGRWVCGVSVFLVVSALVVVGYLFFPRFPQLTVTSFTFTPPGYSFTLLPSANSSTNSTNLNYLTVSVTLTMFISAYNSNPYPLTISSTFLTANLLVNKTAINSHPWPPAIIPQSFIGPPPTPNPSYTPSFDPPIGAGNRTEPLLLPSKETTNFTMDFTLTYTPDPQTGLLRDPAFAEVMNVCGFTSKPRMARVQYNTVNTLSLLGLDRLGYRPTLGGRIQIACPLFEEQLVRLREVDYGNPLGALREVFGERSINIAASSL
ncbi:hypothetical protein HDV05_006090 [Chytridiales sp. JEL 0842]|nr:hypothetical protein HDV05_006090 [Chytridiales sp. JEL 0842]